MTDMRATERLIEYIGEQTNDPNITAAVAELRRRGDTLVRSRDLRNIAESRRRHALTAGEQLEVDAAWQRIENALGSVL